MIELFEGDQVCLECLLTIEGLWLMRFYVAESISSERREWTCGTRRSGVIIERHERRKERKKEGKNDKRKRLHGGESRSEDVFLEASGADSFQWAGLGWVGEEGGVLCSDGQQWATWKLTFYGFKKREREGKVIVLVKVIATCWRVPFSLQ